MQRGKNYAKWFSAPLLNEKSEGEECGWDNALPPVLLTRHGFCRGIHNHLIQFYAYITLASRCTVRRRLWISRPPGQAGIRWAASAWRRCETKVPGWRKLSPIVHFQRTYLFTEIQIHSVLAKSGVVLYNILYSGVTMSRCQIFCLFQAIYRIDLQKVCTF